MSMICNNCGNHMFRSIVDFNTTICNSCGMKHIWPIHKVCIDQSQEYLNDPSEDLHIAMKERFQKRCKG